MSKLAGKEIVLGVCGSIAAYKAAALTSQLTQLGAQVRVILTQSATQFVTPLTFQTLSRNPVAVDLWQEGNGWQPGHIELADCADLFLVAPATANTIANMALGLAPDCLCSSYLATQAPVWIAPAMNGKMLAHAAVQKNLEILRHRGHRIIEPEEGMLACGYEGQGKLAQPESIVDQIVAFCN